MQTPLTLAYEQSFGGLVCGVDEAGRGPLAGPVVAAAVVFHTPDAPRGIYDSKKLTARARERLFAEITACAEYTVAVASVEEVDRLNILRASLLAMQRAVESLPSYKSLTLALIDGNQSPSLGCPHQTMIQGDARCLSIAAASILAKVTRDRLMQEYGKEYPEYGFEKHAGYGTRAHLEALERFGITPIHRQSFAPVKQHLRGAA